MRRIASRLVQLVPTTVGALVLVFFLMRVLPGDPAAAMLGTNATPQSVADLRSQLGLDKPLTEQFVDYVFGLARLDLGRSLAVRTPVTNLLGQALLPTLLLTLGGTLVSVVVGVPLGIIIGRSLWDLFAHAINAVPHPTVPALTITLITIGAVVLANLVAAIPARQAARTRTAVLLRAE